MSPKFTALTEKLVCPACSGPLSATLTMRDRPVVVGDMALCSGCQAVVRFVEGMRLEAVDEATLTEAARAKVERVRRLQREARTGADVLSQRTVRLKVVYNRMDAALRQELAQLDSPRVSCTRGCDGCCHSRVYATAVEAELIVQTGRQQEGFAGVLALRERASAALAATGSPGSPTYHTAVPCPLLKDGECTVYDVRPGLCRAFFVVSDPRFCHPPAVGEASAGTQRCIDFTLAAKILLKGLAPLTATGDLPSEIRDLDWQLVHSITGDAPKW